MKIRRILSPMARVPSLMIVWGRGHLVSILLTRHVCVTLGGAWYGVLTLNVGHKGLKLGTRSAPTTQTALAGMKPRNVSALMKSV